MSAEISNSELTNFFRTNFNSSRISFEDAKELGIDVEKFEYADTNDDNYFDIDEISDIDDLLAAFTTAVEKKKSAAEDEKNADEEKAEQRKVSSKQDAKNK